jgi:hypothetical protein
MHRTVRSTIVALAIVNTMTPSWWRPPDSPLGMAPVAGRRAAFPPRAKAPDVPGWRASLAAGTYALTRSPLAVDQHSQGAKKSANTSPAYSGATALAANDLTSWRTHVLPSGSRNRAYER